MYPQSQEATLHLFDLHIVKLDALTFRANALVTGNSWQERPSSFVLVTQSIVRHQCTANPRHSLHPQSLTLENADCHFLPFLPFFPALLAAV